MGVGVTRRHELRWNIYCDNHGMHVGQTWVCSCSQISLLCGSKGTGGQPRIFKGPPRFGDQSRVAGRWWWTFAHTSTTRCGAPPALARPIPLELRARGGSGGSGGSGSAGFGSTKSGGQNAESTTRAERRLLLVLHPWPSCQFLSFGSGLDMFDLQAILRASSQPVCVCLCLSVCLPTPTTTQRHRNDFTHV